MNTSDLEKILNRVVNEDPNSPSRVITLSDQDLDRPLDELEVDSLAKAEMVAIIDDLYRLEIEDAEAARLSTPRDVIDFVAGRSKQGAR